MKTTLLLTTLLFFSLQSFAQEYQYESYSDLFEAATAVDVILQKDLSVKTDQFNAVLSKTENNVKPFVDNFNIKVDGGAKITSPKVVTGTILQPVLKVSVKKCVLFICNTIDLDSEFTLIKTTGTCALNYVLQGDLRRSSKLLADLYSNINTSLCITPTPEGAKVSLSVVLLRAGTYASGVVQSETLKFIKLQAPSIVESFSTVMKQNGAKEVLALK